MQNKENSLPGIEVTEEFLDSLDAKFREVTKSANSLEYLSLDGDNRRLQQSLYSLIELFLFGYLNFNLPADLTCKLIPPEGGKLENLKQIILKRSLKSGRLKPRFNCFQNFKSNRFYFGVSAEVRADIISKQEGCIIFDSNSLNHSFFSDVRLAESIAPAISQDQLLRIKHPCRSLIIMDPYLFNEGSVRKIPNLIRFIKALLDPALKKKFELDIFVIRNIDAPALKNGMEVKKCREILESFSDKVSIHLYALTDTKESSRFKESDRYFITNYCLITIGHPFDRPSFMTSVFYPAEEKRITAAYSDWREKVILAGQMRSKALQNCWKSDDTEHCIFF